jgi:hypothetical protein
MLGTDISNTILVANQDMFESGYVIAALAAAGASVIGPMSSIVDIRTLLESGAIPKAIVSADHLIDGPVWELTETLRGHGIAYLILLGSSNHDDFGELDGIPVLRKPFGAYQVVEWVSQVERHVVAAVCEPPTTC